jgi:membrane associated rhomboid family serine protease
VRSSIAASRSARKDGFRVLLVLLAIMWLSEIVDTALDHRLDRYGIEPRDADGLIGIPAAPFLHLGFGHLISNTVPFLTMGFVIAFKGAMRVLFVTAIVALVSGAGTWMVAPESTIHIGASGVVFGYATYLLSRGFFDRDVIEIVIGLAVGLIYGGVLLGGLIPQAGVSWQGHFFGAVGGLVAARALAAEPRASRATRG